MVYRRALHPELFELQSRRSLELGDFAVESWVFNGGHVMRFHRDEACLTEVVIENGDHLPENGLVHALPCIGEKDYELDSNKPRDVHYVTTIQTETLTDNLYASTLNEMRGFADEANGLCTEWVEDDGTACMSLLDTQVYCREFHIQSYHLLGSTGLVLRTQSIFELT
jgi:hypothetical protein